MEKSRRDLAQQLFATALARLEDATEIATAAQASSVSRSKMARCAERLQQAAQAIQRLLGRSEPAATVAGTVETGAECLGAPMPNPFAETTAFRVYAGRGATLRVIDSYGRTVADLSNRLPRIPEQVTITFDASALPVGMYHIQLADGTTVVSRQLIVVR